MKQAVLVSFAVAIAYASGSPGIRPRADASEYPAHASGADVTLGAAVIPSGEVKKLSATNLDSAGYIVLEVGVFPASGSDVDLSPADFTLRVDPNALAERPAEAEAIAAIVTKGDQPSTRQPGYGSIGGAIGIGTGGVDPVTGRRTTGVATAGTGAGTGAEANCRTIACDDRTPLPADTPSPERRREQIEQELWEKGLPDGKTPRAVAGYLYFPKPSAKSKNAEMRRYQTERSKAARIARSALTRFPPPDRA